MRLTALVVLSLSTLTAPRVSWSQPHRTQRQGCALTHTTLPLAEGDAVDSLTAPTVVFTASGAVVVWRDRAGSLRVEGFDAAWRPLGAAREMARPAGAFAVAPTPTGAVIAYVEHDHDVLLARVNAHAEAQNVPRRVAHEDAAIEALSIVRTDAGFTVVWSADNGRMLRGAALDHRGVAHDRPSDLGEGRSPRLAWLPSMGTLALTVEGITPESDASLIGLSPALQVNTRLRWPAATLGPVELVGALHGVQLHGGAATPSLVRVPPSGAALGAASDGPARGRFTLLDLAVDGPSAFVLFDDVANARLVLARTSPDGPIVTPATVRTGAPVPARLAVRDEGVAVVIRREPGAHGAARVVITQATCAQ